MRVLMPDLIKLSVQMRVDTEKKGDWFIAACPLLNVVSQGNSPSQAVERVKEEILALIDFALRRGVLHEMLRNRIAAAAAKREENRFTEVGPFKEFRWVSLDLPLAAIHELSRAA